MPQEQIDIAEQMQRRQPKQPEATLKDEVFWLRCSYDELAKEIYDLTELIGLLQANIQMQARAISEWVGVAEE